jgi:DNA-directed RNA polymerase subunit F
MENKDREYMRFLAACFAFVQCGSPKTAVLMADELLKELEGEQDITGGIVDIVPKRKRSRTTE